MKKKNGMHDGFTLLEVMTSITILAMMILLLSYLFSAITQAIERGYTQSRTEEVARMLLDVIEQDVSQALVRTNTAFRIHQVAGGDALYFISPGIRRKRDNIPRDTGPMRLRLARTLSTDQGLIPDFNRRVILESALGSGDPDSAEFKNLIRLSDIYYESPDLTANDFISVHQLQRIRDGERAYTTPLTETSGIRKSVLPTFLILTINNRTDSNSNRNGPADPYDLPRYIDVAIGFISSSNMEQAMRLYKAQGPTAGRNHLIQYERIYTRRIFMRNTGPALIRFNTTP